MQNDYHVLIATDDENRITAVNSDAFVTDGTGWLDIDQGTGDQYHHAQGNYFPLPIMDERGICRYAYVPDAAEGEPKWRERTQAEMDADYTPPAAAPDPVAVLGERMDTVEAATDELVLLMADMIGGGAV